MRLTSVVMAQLSERHYIRRSIGILLALAIVLIILAIAVPKIGGDRMDAIELAVVRDLQTINRMQVQYKSEFQSFAGTLAELGPQAADLIPAALSSGGYAFWLYGERESEAATALFILTRMELFDRTGPPILPTLAAQNSSRTGTSDLVTRDLPRAD